MNWKKKVEVLGLEVPVLGIIALLAVPLVAGATLSFYGSITGTADVSQSVVLDGNACDTDSSDCTVDGEYNTGTYTAGDTVTEIHTLTNNAQDPATVEFMTDQESGTMTDTSEYDDEPGINTSYQLVTTPFAKGSGWSSEFTTEEASSGDESVKLGMYAEEDTTHVGGVQVPVEPITLDQVDSGGMSFQIKASGDETSGERTLTYVLMIDLGTETEYGRFATIGLPPADQTIPTNDFGQRSAEETDKLSGYFFNDNELSDVVDSDCTDNSCNLGQWHTALSNAGYSDYKVIFAKVQVWWEGSDVSWESSTADPSTYDQDVYIDDVSFSSGQTDGAVTWDLESDTPFAESQSVNIENFGTSTGDKKIVLGYDREDYNFQITNDFAIDLEPDDYTITTEVVPAS